MLLQLLFRLRELLATWARGSERMRYLRGGREVPDVALRLGGWAGRPRVRWAGVYTCPGTRYLHNVVGLQPRVRWRVDEHIGEGVLLVVHLVCGDRAQRAVTTQRPPSTSALGGPEELAALVQLQNPPGLSAFLPEPSSRRTQQGRSSLTDTGFGARAARAWGRPRGQQALAPTVSRWLAQLGHQHLRVS